MVDISEKLYNAVKTIINKWNEDGIYAIFSLSIQMNRTNITDSVMYHPLLLVIILRPIVKAQDNMMRRGGTTLFGDRMNHLLSTRMHQTN